MISIYMARGLADGRHQELLAEAERHRLIAALPAGRRPQPATRRSSRWSVPGPAVAPRPAALLPRAYRPSVI
jgi:hypothetical protein